MKVHVVLLNILQYLNKICLLSRFWMICFDFEFPGKGSDILSYAVHGLPVFFDVNCLQSKVIVYEKYSTKNNNTETVKHRNVHNKH